MPESTRWCAVCKQPLDAERLTLPDTRLCREHALEIQKYGGEFVTSSQVERTSKAGSLKLNFGRVSTQKVRNAEAIERLCEEYERQQHD